jgi:hypothetical protein
VLHLGSVIYGGECKETQKTLEIRNDSRFEMSFDLETVIRADPHHTGPPPFTLTPSKGIVEANGKKVVTVTFRPHRPLMVFKEKVYINVPNQEKPTYVYLYGHCFQYQAYAMCDMRFAAFDKAEAPRDPAFVDALPVGTASGASKTGSVEHPKVQPSILPLKFEDGEKVKCIILGAGSPPLAPVPSFDFQIMPVGEAVGGKDLSSYFSVEVGAVADDVLLAMCPESGKSEKGAKGQVPPGKALKVAFRYNPPEDSSLAVGDVSLDLLKSIGQWITCKVKCVLSGGYAPPGSSPNQEIIVELRAYLQQI